MSDYHDLSSRQIKILNYIKSEITAKGYPPSVREIGFAMGLSSPSTVHMHMTVLEQKGYIHRSKSKNRALEVMDTQDPGPVSVKEMIDIPILGKISAGLPILADENMEDTFPVPIQYLRSSNQDLFMLRVVGESMIEAGILDGDLIIVEHCPTAHNGEIVVALIDDEVTVKTFYREMNHIRLQPENSSMAPIIVPRVEILGKVIGLFRSLR